MTPYIQNDRPKIDIIWDNRQAHLSDLVSLINQSFRIGFIRCAVHFKRPPSVEEVEGLLNINFWRNKKPYVIIEGRNVSQRHYPMDAYEKILFLIDTPPDLDMYSGYGAKYLFRSFARLETLSLDSLVGNANIIWDFSLQPLSALHMIADHSDAKILIWDETLSVELLNRHPCMSYLCPAESCHVKRLSPPRQVLIQPDGWVVPYGLPTAYAIGNANSTDLATLLTHYTETTGGQRFICLARNVFSSVSLSGAIRVFSFNSLLHSFAGESYATGSAFNE